MKILFVCTGNTCRSPMAEGILSAKAVEKGLDIKVDSAGIFAMEGQPVSRNSVEALKIDGINIEDYRAKQVGETLLMKQDLILTMSNGHKMTLLSQYDFLADRVYTMKEYAYNINEDVVDPFGGDLETYISTKEEIEAIINKIIDRL